jgi:hypothetical protein
MGEKETEAIVRRAIEAWNADEVESAGDQVLVTTRWLGKGQSSGLDLDLGIWALFAIRHGVTVRIRYFLDEAEARRAFQTGAESPR